MVTARAKHRGWECGICWNPTSGRSLRSPYRRATTMSVMIPVKSGLPTQLRRGAVADKQTIQLNSPQLGPRTSFDWGRICCMHSPSSAKTHTLPRQKIVDTNRRSPMRCQGINGLRRVCPYWKRQHWRKHSVRYALTANCSLNL